jgi:Cd2+/Zn2+-exporting ATPase
LDGAVLSGDRAARGRATAERLGVAFEAALLPGDKAAAIERARKSVGPVCIVGDGINDAPALAFTGEPGIFRGAGTLEPPPPGDGRRHQQRPTPVPRGHRAMIELRLVFLGGLLGSAHCVGMCGGFAISVGLGASGFAANLRR